MAELPNSVLFACSLNAVRSPMAAGLMRLIHGDRIWVDSVGVRKGAIDFFAIEVMDEIGVDLSGHQSKRFADLEDGFFDYVISLSPEAQHHAVEMTRASACELAYWPTPNPADVAAQSREQRLDAYRRVRDALRERILETFPPPGSHGH